MGADTGEKKGRHGMSRQAEQRHLADTLAVVRDNVKNYTVQVAQMRADIDEMLEHYHDNDVEEITTLNNTLTLHDHMKRALERNEKALSKPYFGRIDFYDETYQKEESLYIGRGGIARDTTHWVVVDWRAPVANAYYENGLGQCSYASPDGGRVDIDLQLKRTYEIEDGRLLDYFDSEVIANDDLLTKYLAKNKQEVLGEIVATIQKEQNEIIRKSPYHNLIVQGVAGSGKTTVAMHRISFILYNYEERFRPEDFYIVGSNRILLNYITGVLPDLDVYGVRQMTMEQLFVRLLYEDWDEKKYRIRMGGGTENAESVKGKLAWFLDLKRYCDELEWQIIPRESVCLNPRQFVEGYRDGKIGVFDETGGKPAARGERIVLMEKDSVERYIRQNPRVSVQSKINMLNERLQNRIKEEFLGKGVKYTDAEKKAILKAYRGRFGGRRQKRSLYERYRDFLAKQIGNGYDVEIPRDTFDVYDLAALAYLYKRLEETEVISEAHHVVIDEAQDFGMMAYASLKFCMHRCTYTIMGDVSQNIRFGCGLDDWEELRELFLTDEADSFGILKKSYRNTAEIAGFAAKILQHGHFCVYPAEPILRHGEPVRLQKAGEGDTLAQDAAKICWEWKKKGFDTIAVICRDQKQAGQMAVELGKYLPVKDSDPERMDFGSGIMVLPVEYTKGLEFDAVLLLDPDRQSYPADDGHAKLLYVAATRALHALCVLYRGELSGLLTDPVPQRPESGRDRTVSKMRDPDEKRTIKTGTEPAAETDSRDAAETAGAAGAGTGRVRPRARISLAGIQAGSYAKGQQTSETSVLPKPPKPPLEAPPEKKGPSFGDMPTTERLRPMGHTRIDLGIRWIAKETDGLFLQSRYGVLRLCPAGSRIVRVTFAKGSRIAPGASPAVAVRQAEGDWRYQTAGNYTEFSMDGLCLRVNQVTGAIHYMTAERKLLLAERDRECRLLETGPDGILKSWLYLEWTKAEKLYGLGPGGTPGMPLRRTARYLSGSDGANLPLIFSDRGYAIVPAGPGPVFCCDIPAYGSCLCAMGGEQMDFYFLAGRTPEALFDAYARLCGKGILPL